MNLRIEAVAKAYKALYPEELIERYDAGERDFEGVNLLRIELEQILGPRLNGELELIALGRNEAGGLDPYFFDLWTDFCKPIEQRFEWDSYGRFIPSQLKELGLKDLGGADLSGINLAGAYLYPVSLTNANLSRANLRKVKLIDADLRGANLDHADLRYSILNHANLSGANLYMARLEGAKLSFADLRGADLRRSKLRKTAMNGTDLRGADLRKAHFERTWLNGAKLAGVNLQDVELHDACVTGVSITTSQQAEFLAALGIRLVDSRPEYQSAVDMAVQAIEDLRSILHGVPTSESSKGQAYFDMLIRALAKGNSSGALDAAEKMLALTMPPLTVEEVQKQWLELLDTLRCLNLSAEALMRSCRPAAVEDGNTIVLYFDHDFHRKKAAEPHTEADMERALSQVFKRPVEIRFEVNE